ncbi:helicase PriA [Dehalogenimonas sp. WBC-2]|nr:helicase PriA [Dehalogenimonas sp. WBC-2]
MLYAEVSVNSPAAGRNSYSYEIPAGLNIRPGQAVLVPFGQKTLQGIVVEVADSPRYAETRLLSGVIEPLTCLSPAQLATGLFICRHYLSPLFASLALWLPPGFQRQTEAVIKATGVTNDAALSPLELTIMESLGSGNTIEQKTLERRFGKTATQSALRHLLEYNLVDRNYRLQPLKIKPKLERVVRLTTGFDSAQAAADKLSGKAPKQSLILYRLVNSRGSLPAAELRKDLGEIDASLASLKTKGLIETVNEEFRRAPRLPVDMELPLPPTLTTAQDSAVKAVVAGINDTAATGKAPIWLLHGVTGSGKTEVYLNATKYVLTLRKQVIILVPEIALTHQIIERFTARFPGRVAVLHSKLSLGERFDQWRAVSEGTFDIVIGPRSALFAPVRQLGLIIMDEEHEWAYKQQDTPPLYHARTVAKCLAQEYGATLLLGSATPDVESYYKTVTEKYGLLDLPDRLTPYAGASLPPVSLIDMRMELKSGNLSIFSHKLRAEIEAALKNREQIILFYNRRGGATFIQCRDCGEVLKCHNCLLPLGYHPIEKRLVCHHCNAGYRVPEFCPVCRSKRIKYLGLGTQKLEEETHKEFPAARILRWDSDATHGKDSGYQIFDDFRSGRADILIGTQVVARGLDLPRVSLVGVINADTALNLPDFRAGERTFQLLAQVAGRAGRGEFPGRVVVQSYQPGHYAITTAVNHDYQSFYQKEISYRELLGYPPFGELAVMTVSHIHEAEGQQLAGNLMKKLSLERDSRGLTSIEFLGPSPAFVPRRGGRYRWQVILKGRNLSDFLVKANLPSGISVDIDPLGLD